MYLTFLFFFAFYFDPSSYFFFQIMQPLLQSLDELHLREDKTILKALEVDGKDKTQFL